MFSHFGDARLPSRFWAKVDLDVLTGCWLWTASLNGDRLPQFSLGRDPHLAITVAHRTLIGVPLPRRIDRHSASVCGNRTCVNPGADHFDPASGLVSAAAVAARIGVREERIQEWARDGIIPSHLRGRQRRYSLDEVLVVLDVVKVGGRAYRNGRRGRSVRTRAQERGGAVHTCAACNLPCPASEFPASAVTRGVFVCRQCRRRSKASDRDQLSDAYVKDQLTKKTGLRAGDMPSLLVDAHRANLKVGPAN